MRTIKFRAWDKEEKVMRDADDTGDGKALPLNTLVKSLTTRSFELMQFTGLLDKNGKEIYEGDLVTIRQNGHISTIEFTDGCFMMVHKHKDLSGVENGGYEQVLGFLAVPVEVIGNIYENPELLK